MGAARDQRHARHPLTVALLAAVTLASCGDGAAPAPIASIGVSPPSSAALPSGAAPTVPPASASPPATASAAPPPNSPPSASAAAASTGAAPAVPESESPAPTLDEWLAAPVIQGSGGPPPSPCSMRVLREWARADCHSGTFTHLSKYGRPGLEYFEDLSRGAISFRMKKREVWSTLVKLPDARVAHLLMVWPTDDAKPLVLSFESAPQGVTAFEVRPPQPLPTFPPEPGPRPSKADWYKATPVNTGSGVPTCALDTYAGWARVRCRKGRNGRPSFQAVEMGAIQKDYFISRDTESFEVEVPLARGRSLKALIPWESLEQGPANFQASWKDGPKPETLALSMGVL